MMPEIEIIIIAIILVLACVIPGTFLVLRRLSLMSDAISHSSLLGIIVVFLMVQRFDSIWLILGASLVGMMTVALTEALIATKRLKSDAAIGLVFPVFFSLGVILINKFAGHIHLDADCILFGEIAFTPFTRFVIQGWDLGPTALWVVGSVFILNLLLLLLFYKELKLSTFDEGLAISLGFKPRWIHYGLMFTTAVTAVAAFKMVGSILVVALMITPPATALLVARKLSTSLLLAMGFGVGAVVIGYGMSVQFDGSVSGSIVSVCGLLFLIVFLLGSPQSIMARLSRYQHQKLAFSLRMLMVQLFDHEGKKGESFELTMMNMVDHMGWTERFSKQVVRYGVRQRCIVRHRHDLALTDLGREMVRGFMVF